MKAVNLKKYYYIIRNSFHEQNQSWVSFVSRTFQPIVMISGYYLFYNYLYQQTGSLSLEMYYGYIVLVSLVDVPRFAQYIQNDIKSERYTVIDKLPIHPFTYYFYRNIGLSLTTLITCVIIASIVFIVQGISAQLFILILIAAMVSIILSHLLSFTVATIVFYTEQIHVWMFGMLFEFLGGKIIPIVALPALLQTTLVWILPFGLASGAMALHVSQQKIPSILLSIALASLWSLFLYSLVRKLWDKGGFYFQEHG